MHRIAAQVVPHCGTRSGSPSTNLFKVAVLGLLFALSACGGGGDDIHNNNASSPTAPSPAPSPAPAPGSYTLQVSVVGSGSVSSAPDGISCGIDCSETYAAGTSVTLAVTPANGFTFSGWGNACSGSSPTCTVAMSAARSVSATFSAESAPGTYSLMLNVLGDGTVAMSPTGTSCGTNCYRFATGTSVTLTPTATNGATHVSWIGGDISCAAGIACSFTMNHDRSVSSSFSNPTRDLCPGLVTDRTNRPRQNTAKPALLGSYTDPNFGTTIRRITDVATQGQGASVIKPLYSTVPAWNADESYLILYRVGVDGIVDSQHLLYDGKTYAYLRTLDIDPADLEQVYWHVSDPDILFYVTRSTRRLIRYHVSNGTKDTLKSFTCNADLTSGSDPMYLSWDSDVIGLSCGYDGHTDLALFSYRLSTDAESIRITRSRNQSAAPMPGPSGKFFYHNESDDAVEGSDAWHAVRDFDMNSLRTLDLHSAHEHAALGMLPNGDDAYFGVQFEAAPGGTGSGTLVMHNLSTGASRVVIGHSTGYNNYPPAGTHLSGLSFHNPGWVAISVIGSAANGQSLLDNELLLARVSTDGSSDKICRVGHHHSCGGSGCGTQGYWSEPHVVLSPKGTRLLFGSDWRGGATVDTYVVELPGYEP